MRRLTAMLLLLLLSACAGTETKTAVPASTATTTSPAAPPSATDEFPTDIDTVPGEGGEEGVEETPTPDPELAELKIGEGVSLTSTVNDKPMELNVVVQSTKSSTRAFDQYSDKPKGKYVGMLVQYTCKVGACDYNPYDWTLRNADGEEFDKSFESFEPDLQSGNLRKGRRAKGYITYDLKPGNYFFEYSASISDSEPASWVFKVK